MSLSPRTEGKLVFFGVPALHAIAMALLSADSAQAKIIGATNGLALGFAVLFVLNFFLSPKKEQSE